MSNLVGRVHFTAVLDGRGTERDAEVIGRKAGAAAGEGYDKTWQKSYRDTLTESGKKAFDQWQKNGEKDAGVYGKAFTRRFKGLQTEARKSLEGIRLDPGFFDDFNKKFGDAGISAGRLQEQLNSLNNAADVNKNTLNAAKRQVDDWAESQRQAAIRINETVDAEKAIAEASKESRGHLEKQTKVFDRKKDSSSRLAAELERIVNSEIGVGNSSDRVRSSLQKTDAVVEKHGFHWKDLGHNTRQWTLIIGAVLAAMEDLAVLGSAAGAGLVAVGGGAASAVSGVGGLAAVIVTLSKDLEELPADLRPVAAEFKEFTGVFTELRETIARGAFGEMEGIFTVMGSSLRELNPALALLGKTVGTLFSDLAENTRPGTEAFRALNDSILLASPNFKELAGLAGDFGVTFLQAFNRAQPLVEDMFGWIGRLSDRFDKFVNSSNFDVWMRNAQATFESFGGLLDAVGRGLNDLVTPDSVRRTTEFLDNLTEFVPNLAEFLDVLGKLDIAGLLAQALNDIAKAMEPLGPATADAAEALSRIASVGIEAIASGLEGIATVIAPVVQGFADMVDAIPPQWIAQATTGLLALGGAIKGLQLISATAGMLGFASASAAAADGASRLTGAAKGFAGKAGVFGLIAGSAVVAAGAIQGVIEEINDWSGKAREAVAAGDDLADAAARIQPNFHLLGAEIQGTTLNAENLAAALDRMTAENANGGEFWASWVIGASDFGDEAHDLRSALSNLDEPLAALANTNLEAASQQFANYAKQANATDEEVQAMLDSMPAFKKVLEDTALQTGDVATQQEILELALHGVTAEQSNALDAAQKNADALAELSGQAEASSDQVDALADAIAGFGSTTLDTREANREFNESIMDLTASLTENGAALNKQGTEFDITTEAGRANQEAVDSLAESTLQYASSIVKQTGDQEAASAAIQKGRDELVKIMRQLGFSEQAANDYADQLGLIPENVPTAVKLTGVDQAEATLASLTRTRTLYINAVLNRATLPDLNGAVSGSGRPGLAAGSMVYGPTNALIGEAGPEAVVPLDRPLSLVDESVRWLSAIAQGKAMPRFAGGGIGGGSQVTVSPGAIVVEDRSGDPRRTGNEVITRFIERVKG